MGGLGGRLPSTISGMRARRRQQIGGTNKTCCVPSTQIQRVYVCVSRRRHGGSLGRDAGAHPHRDAIASHSATALRREGTQRARDLHHRRLDLPCMLCLVAGNPFKPDGGCSSTLHAHLHREIWIRTLTDRQGRRREDLRGARSRANPGRLLVPPSQLISAVDSY